MKCKFNNKCMRWTYNSNIKTIVTTVLITPPSLVHITTTHSPHNTLTTQHNHHNIPSPHIATTTPSSPHTTILTPKLLLGLYQYKHEVLHTIHTLNTYVKVSDGDHHYYPHIPFIIYLRKPYLEFVVWERFLRGNSRHFPVSWSVLSSNLWVRAKITLGSPRQMKNN